MNIKNTEVRLGNYIYYNDKIVTVTPNDFILIYSRNSNYRAIELNEDWMRMLGAHQTYSPEHWFIEFDIDNEVHVFDFEFKRSGIFLVQNFGQSDDPIWGELCELKTVHQLQNIVFSMSGYELKLEQEI